MGIATDLELSWRAGQKQTNTKTRNMATREQTRSWNKEHRYRLGRNQKEDKAESRGRLSLPKVALQVPHMVCKVLGRNIARSS